MNNLLKIAFRNLLRYRRRTIMTSLLITIGIFAVLIFQSVAGSFKQMMIGQITDSMLGHVQIHRKGYVASIDNLPLNLNLDAGQTARVETTLKGDDRLEAYSERIKFGSVFSNYIESTNVRMVAVDPEREAATCPQLTERISQGPKKLPQKGELLIPELLAKGMNVKVGDTAVLVANNKDGSVNGMQFKVVGVLAGVTGPGGRDGYMQIDDARALLRINGNEVSEVAIRLKDYGAIESVVNRLKAALSGDVDQKDRPVYEIHTWQGLSPFSSIAAMIDLLTMFINVMLVAIVLVSIMNVMVMAVYERIGEIGTIAAMGTLPGKIMAMFIIEGFLLGLVGAAVGVVLSTVAIVGLKYAEISFDFGRQEGLVLNPQISPENIMITALLVILVAVAASLQPARKASRMQPVDALRHV